MTTEPKEPTRVAEILPCLGFEDEDIENLVLFAVPVGAVSTAALLGSYRGLKPYAAALRLMLKTQHYDEEQLRAYIFKHPEAYATISAVPQEVRVIFSQAAQGFAAYHLLEQREANLARIAELEAEVELARLGDSIPTYDITGE